MRTQNKDRQKTEMMKKKKRRKEPNTAGAGEVQENRGGVGLKG